MSEYVDSEAVERFGLFRSAGGIVLKHLNVWKLYVLQPHKAADRARQWHYLQSLPGAPTIGLLLKANDLSPSDPPVVTAEGALRLSAFTRPERPPKLLACVMRVLGHGKLLDEILEHLSCGVKG